MKKKSKGAEMEIWYKKRQEKKTKETGEKKE